MREHVLTVLQGIVGPDSILTGETLPVITPANSDQIAKVMQIANQENIKVLTQYTEAGQNGQSENVLLLSLAKMNAIIDIDTANLVATVEPSVTVTQLNQALKETGLFYPLDPGQGENATFGEVVSQNASGLRGLKYGATKHYVMGLDVILADGRSLKTGGKNVKDVAGYDLTKLMTGSHGTLGIVRAITVKLMPVPELQKLLIASFGNTSDAGRAITAIFAAKVVPSAIEILNAAALKSLHTGGYDSLPDASAVLMLELDGIPAAVEKAAAIVDGILRVHHVQQVQEALTAEAALNYWSSRQAIAPLLAASSAVSLDVTVPRSNLSEALAQMEATAHSNNISIAVFGHAGEGNLFLSILPGGQSDPAKLTQVQEELIQLLRNLGASINGTPDQLALQYGPAGMAAMQHVKKALDPNCILNPGKLVGAC